MSSRLIFILFFLTFLKNYSQNFLEAQLSEKTSFVCSYKCDNSFESLKSNCLNTSNHTHVRDIPIPENEINPYNEFNLVISALRKDRENPFPLAFVFKECNYVCNAASVVIDTVNHIYYNQDFLNKIKSPTKSLKWVVRSIIAHEIGHHILGHTAPTSHFIEPTERRRRELRADYFSAFVIHQFTGSSEENALSGLNSLDSKTYIPKTDADAEYSNYPTLQKRKTAIKQGFTDSNKSELKIAMFKTIDSVVKISEIRWGRSVIFHEIDEFLSFGNYIEARQKLEELQNSNFAIDLEESSLMQLKTFLDKKILEKDFEIESKPDLAPTIYQKDDIKVLQEFYNKYKSNESILNKKESEVLLRSIKQLEKVKEIEN